MTDDALDGGGSGPRGGPVARARAGTGIAHAPADSDAGFLLYPAIDIRHGRVVRLLRGDAGAETVFGLDPGRTAADLVRRGAARLHVVDLDAAFGDGSGTDAVTAVIRAVGPSVEVQVGGGLRDDAAIDAALARGAARAILGTAALEDPAVVRRAIERHGPGRIAAALDVRGSAAVGGGWIRGAPAVDLARATATLLEAGVRRFVVTAVERDGTLAGPDVETLACARAAGAPEVIASGGIRSLADLAAVAEAGSIGAVVGRALYEGGLDVESAVAWAGAWGGSWTR